MLTEAARAALARYTEAAEEWYAAFELAHSYDSALAGYRDRAQWAAYDSLARHTAPYQEQLREASARLAAAWSDFRALAAGLVA